jgi:hypothetical protein
MPALGKYTGRQTSLRLLTNLSWILPLCFEPCATLSASRGQVTASFFHAGNSNCDLLRLLNFCRVDQEYLKDFNAAIDQLQKKKEEFQAEHPPFGSRYS